MTKKTTKIQMGFFQSFHTDDEKLQVESGAIFTLGELRKFIKENGLQQGDLFPTSKEDDSKKENDMIPDDGLILDANKKGDDGDSLIPD